VDLQLRIIGGMSLFALVVRGTARVADGVGWEGAAGTQGFDVELGVFPVLGSEICTQSNLLVRLDDFLKALVELLKDVVAFSDALHDALEEDCLSLVVRVLHLVFRRVGESDQAGIRKAERSTACNSLVACGTGL